MKLKKLRFFLFFFLLICALIVSGCSNEIVLENNEAQDLYDNNKLIVHFLDVGQADCILIQLPNGEVSLIDGGNRDDAEFIIDYLQNLKIKRIEYLIATHPHEDHIGGLPKIIKSFDIGNIYAPLKEANTKVFESFLTEVKNKGLKINAAMGGMKIIDEDDLQYIILAPNSKEYEETNEYSIVNKLSFKDISFLFTGDAEKVSENEMMEKGFDLSSNVLKVGHHGGYTSTNENFLKRVNPEYAVISVGKDNDYGHPSSDVLDRLKKENVKILRTDELGTIIMTSDGVNISISNVDDKVNSENSVPNKEVYYIGNKKTKVYHLNSCNSLPSKDNQIIFKNKEEAEKRGFRPHKTCVD